MRKLIKRVIPKHDLKGSLLSFKINVFIDSEVILSNKLGYIPEGRQFAPFYSRQKSIQQESGKVRISIRGKAVFSGMCQLMRSDKGQLNAFTSKNLGGEKLGNIVYPGEPSHSMIIKYTCFSLGFPSRNQDYFLGDFFRKEKSENAQSRKSKL